jgi:hypothetical protein
MTIHRDPWFDERIADWLQDDADHAPPIVLDVIAAAVPSIPQRRHSWAPWRTFPMSFPIRSAVGAGVLIVVAVFAIAVLRPTDSSSVGGRPGSPAPPLIQAIPDGRYVGAVQQVADILDQLARDASLTAGERDIIIDTVLGIRGASTYQTVFEIEGSSMTLSQSVDGQANPESWFLAPAGDDRIAATWSNGKIEFEVRGCALPGPECVYTFQAITPAPSDVEAFVRRLVFETSGPFTPST